MSNVRALVRVRPKRIEDRPSVLVRIASFFSGIAEFGTGFDAIYFVFSLFIGLGFLGYLVFVWVSHFLHNGQFLVGGIVGIVIIAISLAAILRSYIALTLALGAATVCGVAFLSGASHVFLP